MENDKKLRIFSKKKKKSKCAPSAPYMWQPVI